MRHRPAWLLAVPLLLSTAAPVGAGGPSCVAPPVVPGVWTPAFAPVDVTYADGYGEPGVPRYETTVDPFCPGRAYRVGTPEQAFADRGVVQRTTDGGRTWTTVLSRPAPFAVRHVYVPDEDHVYAAEAGAGAAVLRSTDGGATWQGAAGGLEGRHVHALTFAPSDPATAYAVILPCGPDPLRAAKPACHKASADTGPFVGLVELWVTTDRGAHWTKRTLPDEVSARREFSVQVDPHDAGAPYIYDRFDGTGVGDQTARVHVGQSAGSRFETNETGVLAYPDSFRAFRSGGALWLLARNQHTGTDVVSKDGGKTFPPVTATPKKTEQTPTEPDRHGRLFGLWVTGQSGSFAGHDARATWSDDRFDSLQVETGRFPSWLPPDTAYKLERTQVAGDVFYVTVARQCHTDGTYEGDKVRCPARGSYWTYQWTTWAYRIPADPTAWTTVALGDEGKEGPAACLPPACAPLDAGTPCPLPANAATGTGLAYDGESLIFPVQPERPGTVVLGYVDAATCARARPDVTIPLDPAHLADAVRRTRRTHVPFTGEPTLDAGQTVASTLAYDGESGTVWFSLHDSADDRRVAQGNPASVWAWPGSGPARLVYTGDRCLHHPQRGSGMELLAWDRDDRSLATCADARPLPVGTGGAPRTPYCLRLPPFRGYGYGWPVTSWTDAEDGRALLLVDEPSGTGANLVAYDLSSCTLTGVSFGAAAIGAAKGPGRSAQLTCDAGSGSGTRLWHRTGRTVTPYPLGDGTAWCRIPTSVTVVPEAGRTCAMLRVAGHDRPVPGRTVTMSIDGTSVDATTTATGAACVARVARRDAHADFAGDTSYLPSDGVWPPLPPPRLVPPRPVAVPPVPQPAAPQAPQPAAPPPVVIQPPPVVAVAVPAQAPAPGANVGALSDQRDEQQQLAYVGEPAHDEAEDEEPAAEELFAVGLVMAAAVGVALRRRAAEVLAQSRR